MRRGAEGRPGSENGSIATGRLTREPGRPRFVHAADPGRRGIRVNNFSWPRALGDRGARGARKRKHEQAVTAWYRKANK